VPTAPTIDPSVFHAYTRALAAEASRAELASSRTANGNVAPTQSVSGSSIAIASSAPGASAFTEAPSAVAPSRRRSEAQNASQANDAVATCA
jgi:hypothetical protein